MMKLEWSPDALDDLDGIFERIAEDDVYRASMFIDEIREKASDLLYAPKAGMMIPELGREEFREWHYKNYTIVYEICPESIRIHEVFHQRRIHIRTYRRM